MKFCLFSDFHYKKRMYAATISMMQEIIDKAEREEADFILNCGDACNDYYGSPEFINCFLKNDKDIPVYGVYGNHELESANNSMAFVTPNICNRAQDVIWGTEDKQIGDGNIAYYYFDYESFRIICLDTNYSFNPIEKIWEHNKTSWWTFPKGNINTYALGDRQIQWLKAVVDDAANKGKHCILVAHAPFIKEWRLFDKSMTLDDCDIVAEIINSANAKKAKTVIACFNGHWHTDRHLVRDGVLFFDTNAALNGFWEDGHAEDHYLKTHTFDFIDYDDNGIPKGEAAKVPLGETGMGKETWYFKRPLSAIVEISADCSIRIYGEKTGWKYGILPKTENKAVKPEISSICFNPNDNTEI